MTAGGSQRGGGDEGFPLPLRIATVLLAIGLFCLVVIGVARLQSSRGPAAAPAVAGSGAPGATGPSFVLSHDLSRPIRHAVVLVPLDDFPTERATALRDRLAADYRLPISVAEPLSIHDETYDPASRQLVAESVIDRLGAWHPEWQSGTVVIGLSTTDLRIEGRPDWRFAFSYRSSDGVAVVSSANMSVLLDFGEDAGWNRFGKMVLRQVAFLYYGLRPVQDPSDILFNNILSTGDVDHIADHL
jgi:hypothetical protein